MMSNAVEDLHSQTTRPAIILCGPTASGKSTIADQLAELVQGRRIVETAEASGLLDDHRRADLELLRKLEECRETAVIESAALPGLLPVNNTALIVHLTASAAVRGGRLSARSPKMSHAEAIGLVELTDAVLRDRLRDTWAIDTSPKAERWAADLVVGCPHPEVCVDETDCIDTVTFLIAAAFRVYEQYVSAAPRDDRLVAVDRIRTFTGTSYEHVQRCTPALINPTNPITPQAWRNRRRTELETRARSL